MQEQTQ
ncbi:hypothetical protein VN97_g11891, partial [Penicillium thymicola]